jgi:DNA-binding transcriptional LysR family regulator
VSKQVKQLSRSLGVTLLERKGRGVRLTEAGQVLADYARQIVSLADAAQAALTDLESLRRGTLAVGATPTIATYLLPDVLVYFRQRFPGIRVGVQTAPVDVLASGLADGTLDTALADETLMFPGITRQTFLSAPFVAIAPRRHRLAAKRALPLSTLMSDTLVLRESGAGDRSLVERFLADAGLTPPSTLTFGSTEAVKRAVEAGLGIGMVPRLSVEREVAAGRLCVLRVSGLTLTRPLYEVWSGNRSRTKAAKAFHCVLEHAVRGTLPSRPRGKNESSDRRASSRPALRNIRV